MTVRIDWSTTPLAPPPSPFPFFFNFYRRDRAYAYIENVFGYKIDVLRFYKFINKHMTTGRFVECLHLGLVNTQKNKNAN